MRKCIICLKEKNENDFDIEHIIPESFGNKKLTINCVCKKCNNKIGTEIDAKNSNASFYKLIRSFEKIKGKDGIANYSFPAEDKKGNKYVLRDRLTKIENVPKVIQTDNSLQINGVSKDKAKEIISTKHQRGSLSDSQYAKAISLIDNIEPSKDNIELSIDISINYIYLVLEMLKIIYEYSYLKFGEIIEKVPDLENIRRIIFDAIYNIQINDECLNYIEYNLQLNESFSILSNAVECENDNPTYSVLFCFTEESYLYMYISLLGIGLLFKIENAGLIIINDFELEVI